LFVYLFSFQRSEARLALAAKVSPGGVLDYYMPLGIVGQGLFLRFLQIVVTVVPGGFGNGQFRVPHATVTSSGVTRYSTDSEGPVNAFLQNL